MPTKEPLVAIHALVFARPWTPISIAVSVRVLAEAAATADAMRTMLPTFNRLK